jgi:hypothetical protein
MKNSLTYKAISRLADAKFQSLESFTEYLRFLADTGNLGILYKEINEFANFSHLRQDQIKEDLVLKLARFYRRLPKVSLLEEVTQLDQMCSYLLQYDLVDQNLQDKFLDQVVPNVDLERCNHTENMMFAFIVTKLLDQDLLSEQLAIHLVKFFAFCKRRNNIRSDYIIIRITEYALKHRFEIFFKLGKRYNHLQNILARIYTCEFLLSDDEKRILSQRILNQTYLNNDLSMPSVPKIAICISGIYRGHETALQSIKKVADELDADIYMHTWDQTAHWPGIGGTPSFIRLFGAENEKKITEEFRGLNNILRIKRVFPSVYDLISVPIYQKTDIDTIRKNLGESANILIENQDRVIESLVQSPHNFDGRGGLNQLKMFYGMKKSFEMAVNSGHHYDYIIRTRPDVYLQENLINLKDLQKNTFYGLIERVVGFTDLEFLISGEMAYSFIHMVDEMFKLKRLSPYEKLPKYDSHLLMFAWILHNKYEVSQDLFHRNLLDSSHFNVFEGIDLALQSDIKNLSEDEFLEYQDFIIFIIEYCHLKVDLNFQEENFNIKIG